MSNIRDAILPGVKNCTLKHSLRRDGVRNTMKNFSAPKYLAYVQPRSWVTSYYYRIYRCVMNRNEHYDHDLVSTVARPAPHRFYCQTRSCAHLDNGVVIRHIGIKTTDI